MDAIRRATGHATPEFYYILFPDHNRDLVYNVGMLVEEEEQKIIPLLCDKLLFEGCRELLIHLKKRGINLYIASTGEKNHVYSILNQTGIIDFFNTISCGLPDKTEMLRKIIDNSEKNGCVMVGDMKKDYEAAQTNGIVSVGACYGYCIRESSEFDLYIHSPLDLLDILKI
jgi:HAD superfamily hydrolase (TIGR01549 family)